MTDERHVDAGGEALDRIGPLADPVRRRLYEHVAAAHRPVDRDDAAAAIGIGRPLAAFHLDRLVAAGLLDAEFHRRSGRSGPGAGRPAKFYRRPRDRELAVTMPPRDYGAIAEVLAQGVAASEEARAVATEAAQSRGRELARKAGSGRGRATAVEALELLGYEPVAEADGTVRLRNCPFDRIAAAHRDVACPLNLATLDAMTETLAAGRMQAVAQPRDAFCCVALVPVRQGKRGNDASDPSTAPDATRT